MWDERYTADEYIFGTEPNDFLKQQADRLKPGSVLCLADGEGRNGVYPAKLGFKITALDSSLVGLEKAQPPHQIVLETHPYVTFKQLLFIDKSFPILPRQIIHELQH